MMQVTCKRDDLKRAVDGVAKFRSSVGKDGTSGIRLFALGDNIWMTSTDGAVVATRRLAASVTSAEGEVLLPGELFQRHVASLIAEEVHLETKGRDLAVVSGELNGVIKGLSLDNFPEPARVEPTFSLDAAILSRAMERVSYAAAVGEHKVDALRGIFLKGDVALRLMASDASRGAIATIPVVAGEFEAIVFAKTLKDVTRQLKGEVRVGVSKTALSFESEEADFWVRQMNGLFPDFASKVPPVSERPIIVSAEALSSEMRSLLPFSDAETILDHTVTLVAASNFMTVRVRQSERGQAMTKIPVSYGGADLTMMVNPYFLIEAAEALDGTLSLSILSGGRQMLIEPEDRSAIAIVMGKTK